MDQAELRALEEKLRELIALRALAADDSDAARPADRLRALATRFPGALRELDRSPLETLTGRLAALIDALAGGPVPDWAAPTSRYHGWLRIGLRLRAEADRADAAAVAWAEAYVPVFPGDPARDRLEPRVLRLLVAPPEGRLVAVASSLAAEDLGVSPAVLEGLLDGR